MAITAPAEPAARPETDLDRRLADSLERVLVWSAARDYAGYSKFDVFNSPLMRVLSLGNPTLRVLMTAVWARSPIDPRPLAGTRRSRNPKGIALFALAYLRRHRAGTSPRADGDLDRARRLLDWLDHHAATGYHGKCWGYDHPWQSVHFYAPRDSPNIVVTGNVAHAFLEAYETTGEQRFLEIARSSVDFLLEDLLAPVDTPEMRSIGYVPGVDWGVLNINGLAASVMARTARHTGEKALRDEARRLIAFLVDKQTDDGAWHYAWPAETSNVRHDNYHTGNVLDWILDYTTLAGDDRFLASYARGLEFYRRHLFTPDGLPKWRSDRTYPADAHSAAQSIVTFAKAAAEHHPRYLEDGRRVARWTIDHLQHPDGYFYYQRGRWWLKRYTLMRWCNAWMAFALATLLQVRTGDATRCAE